MPRMENWFIRYGCSKDTMNLLGEVYDSDNFDDGDSITTSGIVELTDDYAQTRNTKYELGVKRDLPKYKSKSKYYLLRKGGEAIHKTGNISRNTFDVELITVHSEDEGSYTGNFVEGFGFVNVKFKKSDCRLATNEELVMCDNGKMELIMF